jgi:hypothetical protein
MALGEKLFEEGGEITSLKITRVHPIEGVTTEVSFTSEIRGEGRYPSGQSLGSGISSSGVSSPSSSPSSSSSSSQL